jgi:hypothetical protein
MADGENLQHQQTNQPLQSPAATAEGTPGGIQGVSPVAEEASVPEPQPALVSPQQSIPNALLTNADHTDTAVSRPEATLRTQDPSADQIKIASSEEIWNDPEPITWTASEFIAHPKAAIWYIEVGAVGLVLALLILFLTHDTISSIVVIVATIVFAAYAARQPRQLQYSLDGESLHIAAHTYALTQFRSFAVVPEGAFSSVVFYPLKRFAPLVIIYFAPDDETKIYGLLADRLPITEHNHDPVDRFLKRIRF